MPDPSSNESLYNNAIVHAILLQAYKTHLTSQALTHINTSVFPELIARLQRQAIRIRQQASQEEMVRMQAKAADSLRKGYDRTEKLVTEELEGLSALEAEIQLKRLRDAARISLELQTPSPSLIRQLVTEKPFEGELLGDWFGSLHDATATAINRQMTIGMVNGESIGQITDRIHGSLDVSRRNIESVVRTAVSHVSAQARNTTLVENASFLKGILWVSTLDGRTTAICRKLDHKIFPVDSGPRPPAHWGCRSTIVPVLKSWKELGFDIKDLPDGTRASMNGQVPVSVSYPEWLRSQSKSTQNKVLGKQRAGLFRKGTITVDQFVDDKGRSLSLDELRDLEGLGR